MADLAKLGIVVDADGAARQVDRLKGKLEGLGTTGETTATKVSASAGKIAQSYKLMLGAAAAAAAAGSIRKIITETIEAERAQAQLEAVIRSTGGTAGRTARELNVLAAELQKTTAYSDDAVSGVQSLLLTFTQIRGKEFDEATRSVLDMATAMGGDARGAALQLGKALNDPIQGISALSRVGVTFNASQEKVIRNLVETGRQAEAQRAIMAELRKEFGGSAVAAGNTLGGSLDRLKNHFGDLFEQTQRNTTALTGWINRVDDALVAWNKWKRRNDADFSDVTGLTRANGMVTVIRAQQTEAEIQAQADRAKKALDEQTAAAKRFKDMLAGVADIAFSLSYTKPQVALPPIESAGGYRSPSERDYDARHRGPTGQSRLQEAANAYIVSQMKASEQTSRFAKAAERAAQVVSQSIEYMLVQKLGGGTAAGNFGASLAKTGAQELFGSFSAFGSKALGSAIFGPIAAGIGAAFGNAADAIFDFSGKAKEAARQLQAMRAATDAAIQAFHNQATPGYSESLEGMLAPYLTTLNQNVAAARRDYDGAEEQRRVDQLYADYAKIQAAITAQFVETQRYKSQDLEVRALRAQGNAAEADRLALANQQQQELIQAQLAGYDAAYIARLKEVQALEASAKAFNNLTTSMRNAPSGFKIEGYIDQYAAPRTSGLGGIPGASIPYRPQGPTGPKVVQNIVQVHSPIFEIKGATGRELLVDVARELDKVRNATIGMNDAIYRAWEYV